MLINLSNHPFAKWSHPQKDAAQKYGLVVDLAFPVVQPLASTQEIGGLAEIYKGKVLYMLKNSTQSVNAVHLMGELTFSFALLQLLQQEKVICVASTTNRIVAETGNSKTVEFDFCQFREYTNY